MGEFREGFMEKKHPKVFFRLPVCPEHEILFISLITLLLKLEKHLVWKKSLLLRNINQCLLEL